MLCKHTLPLTKEEERVSQYRMMMTMYRVGNHRGDKVSHPPHTGGRVEPPLMFQLTSFLPQVKLG